MTLEARGMGFGDGATRPGHRGVVSSRHHVCSYEAPFYVDGYNQPRAFLATPLHLPYKFNFFWKQIWEQKVAVIVMLENIAENGKVIGAKFHIFNSVRSSIELASCSMSILFVSRIIFI